MIQIGDVFAVSLSEEERYENDVSDHPAERGPSFIDNSVSKALVINRDCTISADTSLDVFDENRNAAFGPNIIEGCRARLIAIRETREPISVRDSTGTYVNMEVMSLVFSRTVKTGKTLAFKISFKQLDVITNERSVVQVAIPRAQKKSLQGLKISKKPDPPPPTKDIDPLRPVSNGVSNFIVGHNIVNPEPN